MWGGTGPNTTGCQAKEWLHRKGRRERQQLQAILLTSNNLIWPSDGIFYVGSSVLDNLCLSFESECSHLMFCSAIAQFITVEWRESGLEMECTHSVVLNGGSGGWVFLPRRRVVMSGDIFGWRGLY